MTTQTRNAAAERLLVFEANLTPKDVETIREALAAERRATVERIKRRLEEDAPDTIGFRIWAILDEEAAR